MALPGPRTRPVRRPFWRRWIFWGVIAALLIVGLVLFRLTQRSAARAGARGAQGAAVHVVAERAHKGSIGSYVAGLGTVFPLHSVTVTSRIDGQLMNVYYREGQIVRQGDLLLEIDPRPYEAQLSQYEGTLARDQALLANARVDLTRYRTLLTRNAIPEQTVATQEALVRQYEGNVRSDEGLVESAKLNISYTRITAPISGRTGLRLVDPGNMVTANATSLVVITQIDPISVIFTVSEDQLPSVRASLRRGRSPIVDIYDRSQMNMLGEGRLETVDNQIDPTTGTVRLRAIFPNPRDALFPDQFVNARLLLEEQHNVTLVQNAAIQHNGTKTYVWFVQPDKTVVNRPVELGTAGPMETEVTSGLTAGDQVVTEGVDELREGVKVNPAAPNTSGANAQ